MCDITHWRWQCDDTDSVIHQLLVSHTPCKNETGAGDIQSDNKNVRVSGICQTEFEITVF